MHDSYMNEPTSDKITANLNIQRGESVMQEENQMNIN